MLTSRRGMRGMVVAPHHLAAQSGLRVLREGGTAIEAVVAAAATVSVVYPHMNGIGGDGFWLISTPRNRQPVAISGIGAAAMDISPNWFLSRGLSAIPGRGPSAAITTAGTVSSWDAALRHDADSGSRVPLERLLEDAIWYADRGVPLTQAHCDMVEAKREELQPAPGWGDLFLPGDRSPTPGALLKQPALADTFRSLAREGLDSFYRGPLARQIAADLERIDSPLNLGDLIRHRATTGAPLTVELSTLAGGASVFNHPPPTQGVASLAILGIFDRLSAGEVDEFDHVHGLVEATKQAFLMREREVTDPKYMDINPQSLLDEEALDAMAARVDPDTALPWPQNGAPGDTVWIGAIDSDGRAVSFIHSIYWEFGSGVILQDTGIQWQNRGCSFDLDPDSRNALKPGRLPFHTNNPAMALFDDGRLMVYGTMGGEGQPQTQAAVFTRYAEFDQDLQEAITAPRWLLGRTWGDVETELRMEGRFDPALIQNLRGAGHRVRKVGDFDSVMGHAGAIVREPGGTLTGATDPRADGAVAAW